MKRHAVPLIVTILLLLPVLYVGSYLALVVPGGKWIPIDGIEMPAESYYRFGGSWSSMAFWPLEQIDRKVRPEAWGLHWEVPVGSSGKGFSRRAPEQSNS